MSSFWDILQASWRYYFPVLQKIFPLIFLIALVKNIYFYANLIFASPLLMLILGFIAAVLIIYFCAVSLAITADVIKKQAINFLKTCREVLLNLPSILLFCGLVIALWFALLGLGKLFNLLFHSPFFLLFFVGVLFLFIMVFKSGKVRLRNTKSKGKFK